LTPLGREVGERVEALADWIEVKMPEIMEARRARVSPANSPTAGVHRLR
jgi:DNA-binding HxlR family transcriptional regulator